MYAINRLFYRQNSFHQFELIFYSLVFWTCLVQGGAFNGIAIGYYDVHKTIKALACSFQAFPVPFIFKGQHNLLKKLLFLISQSNSFTKVFRHR